MPRHRHIVIATAVVACLTVAPGLAHAAGPGAATAPSAQPKPGKEAKTAGPIAPSALSTFQSPAEASVRQQDRSAAEGRQAAAAATANSSLAVGLHAETISAYSINLRTMLISDLAPLDLVIDWGDGTSDRYDGLNPGLSDRNHQYAKLGQYTVSVTVSDRSGGVSTNAVTLSTEGSEFTPYGPTRLLDTRDGTGAPAGRVQPWGETRVKIAGNGGIPAGVTAVALNLTAVEPGGAGHIIAYPGGTERPTTSNVNYVAGRTVPNLAIVPVGSDGYVNLANRGVGAVDLIADIAGYFTQNEAAGYTAVSPTRLVDTRDGTGTTRGQVPGWTSFSAQVTGRAGVPAGARAVALNVTVTDPNSDGHLTVYPGGGRAPSASNLNFYRGQTIANAVIVPVDAAGRIQVLNAADGASDVIVDVVGYYGDPGGSAYVAIEPLRLGDTRDSPNGGLPSQSYVYVDLSAGLPEYTGFVLNTTVTNTAADGHLTVFPDPNSLEQYYRGTNVWPAKPNASTLNWKAGDTVPNLVQANPGSHGIVDFWNASGGDIDLIIDMFGYYQNR
ncbi:hypothetical protein [Kitasatospora putterlickiae]|uniref:hypothetical protein n=1 Tax=Kitasatospora putterlickiae TaxID=221725 RepID=UPI0031CE5EBB